ncbi:hypothetical protein [Devosia sp. RR2S18]|uniref:hypothetical protein n=1 Tax=Devosia rhizosphaerae TaxID=3049774 RepID=UPI002541C804|nr:hypothetical protein [Devosia sp. RR2S18]WIJ26460.1 hypothetical protein QOV41_06785 [Devosia sp. RR2S18]
MSISIAAKTNTAELIRRAKAADPSATEHDLAARFGVKLGRVKEALRSRGIEANGKQRA